MLAEQTLLLGEGHMAFPPLILLSVTLVVPTPSGPAVVKARALPAIDTAAKRTWTNDDIPFLREVAPITILSASSPPQVNASETVGLVAPSATEPYVKERDPRWYAEQRQALQAQLEADQEQIREIQEIRDTGEGITDAIPLDKEAAGMTPEATVEILQDEIAELESQIGALQDLARINGIPPAVVR
jgi:hypothetical protein